MKQNNSKDVRSLILLIFLICVPFLPRLIHEIVVSPTRESKIEDIFHRKLQNTFLAIQKYYNENNKYPTAENWQDLLLPQFYNRKTSFNLPPRDTKNTIAINPKAEPNSPGDVVLLFESTGGWNAHGQSELLAPTSNGKPGCYILFNDGYIKFISPEQAKNLNWGNKP